MRADPTDRGVRSAKPSGPPLGFFAPTAALALLAAVAWAQEPALQARVPTSYANVHAGPSTNAAPLVLVPEGTVLPIIGRRGEWVEVQLSTELRQIGIVMRWYEGRHQFMNDGQLITIGDEDSGWMHDSTVEITEVETD